MYVQKSKHDIMRLWLSAVLSAKTGKSFCCALGFLPGYYEMMFGFSVFFLIGLVLILEGQRRAIKRSDRPFTLFFRHRDPHNRVRSTVPESPARRKNLPAF